MYEIPHWMIVAAIAAPGKWWGLFCLCRWLASLARRRRANAMCDNMATHAKPIHPADTRPRGGG